MVQTRRPPDELRAEPGNVAHDEPPRMPEPPVLRVRYGQPKGRYDERTKNAVRQDEWTLCSGEDVSIENGAVVSADGVGE